jgi:hypothetical protein
MNSETRGEGEDRVLYWPMAVALAGPVAYVVLLNVPIILVMVILSGIVPALWIVSAFVSLAMCVKWISERAWRRVASTVILPLTVLVVCLNLDSSMRAGAMANDYLNFLIRYPSLRADIAKLPDGRPRFKVWDWRPVWTGEVGLVYDESDEIASEHPSEAWKRRAGAEGVEGSGYRPLYGHFYLVDLQ